MKHQSDHTLIVSGATGFVGKAVVEKLLGQGHQVAVLVRDKDDVRVNASCALIEIGTSCEQLTNNLLDFGACVLVNCAAAGVKPMDRDPKALFQANTVLPVELASVAASAGMLGVVHLGTMSEYRPEQIDKPITENSALETASTYGATKAAGTIALTATATSHGLSSIVLRCFAGYGPGEGEARLLPTLHRTLASGEPMAMSDGLIIRDFIYIDDIVSGILAAISRVSEGPQINEILNLGTGAGVQLRKFAEHYCDIAGFDPELLRFGVYPRRDTDAQFSVADMSHTRKVLNLPASVKRDVAFAKYADWLNQNADAHEGET